MSEPEEKEQVPPTNLGLSRRGFLKLAGAGALAAAVSPRPTALETGSKPELKVTPEQFRVSEKLTLTVVPIEHNLDSLEANKDVLEEVIKNSQGVIPEYFPHEVAHLFEKYGHKYKGSEEIMPFFRFVSDTASSHDKPVFVLDPAHEFKFLALRSLPDLMMWGSWVVWGPLAYKELSKIAESKEELSILQRLAKVRLSRRDFLKLAAVVGAGVLGATGVRSSQAHSDEFLLGKIPEFPTEATFRRAVIAKGLFLLGENLDSDLAAKPQNLVFIYPPFHWQEIEKLLNDNARLEKEFEGWEVIKKAGEDFRSSFFSIRQYTWSNGTPVLSGATGIG